jgi:hypothetical protein
MSVKRDLDIEEIIAEMKKELHTLYAERCAIDRRMDVIKKALVGLATLYGDEALAIDFLRPPDPPKNGQRMSLTDTCRSVIMQSKSPLRTREIHQLLVQKDPDLLKLYKQPFVSVAMVLRRLVKKGQVRAVAKGHGRTEWEWIDPSSDEEVHSTGEELGLLSTREMNASPSPGREASF